MDLIEPERLGGQMRRESGAIHPDRGGIVTAGRAQIQAAIRALPPAAFTADRHCAARRAPGPPADPTAAQRVPGHHARRGRPVGWLPARPVGQRHGVFACSKASAASMPQA